MTTIPLPAPATGHVLGALALELSPGSSAERDAVAQAGAAVLAALVARDLASHEHDAARLQLAIVAAHYDPVELLRPGWPLHAALRELAIGAPGLRAGGAGDDGRIVAFGAHEGRLPDLLVPAVEFHGGPLRLLPFVLEGPADVVATVSAAFEERLMELGMAAADTALAAQDAFGMQLEHARYLTLHDLCAMTALQYEHAGLAPLWQVVETALLAPAREAWIDAPPEPLLHYAEGEARIALFGMDAWRQRYEPEATAGPAQLARRHAAFEARQRQFAGVLQAHAVPVNFVHCPRGVDPDL